MSQAKTEEEILQIIDESGAVLKGHFKLASGRHSDTYVEKFRLLERPWNLEPVVARIAERFKESGAQIIVGPSTGGLIVAYEAARQLGLPALYVERSGEKFIIKRGGKITPGMKVLLVDDVLTTGVSVFEVLNLLRENEADVVGVGVLIDRSGKEIDFGTEFFGACRFQATSYAEDEIPEWLAEIPLYTPGTRAAVVNA